MSGARTRETLALARYYFTDVERAVIKSTSKDDSRALKPKHINVLVAVTFQRDFPMSDMFKFINTRLRENHWVIVFKSLILIHILMREGSADRVTGYLVSASMLNLSHFRDRSTNPYGQAQSRNIHAYAAYLEEKTQSFRVIKRDFVHTKDQQTERFSILTSDQAAALIEETSLIGSQINSLLGCSFYMQDIDNLVTLQAFRLLLLDMMTLFRLLNEGVLRILSLFFEMTRSDAEKALVIYKQFAQETAKSLKFFEIGRKLKQSLGIDVPEFKHAPIQLANALEDYLMSPDFEANRAAYRSKKGLGGPASTPASKEPGLQEINDQPIFLRGGALGMPSTEEIMANPKALIDFFSSIDNHLVTVQDDPLFITGQHQQHQHQQQGGILTAVPGMRIGTVNNGAAGANPFQPIAIEYNLQTTNPFDGTAGPFGATPQQSFDSTPVNQPGYTNHAYNAQPHLAFGHGDSGQLQMYNSPQQQQQHLTLFNPFSQPPQHADLSSTSHNDFNNSNSNPFQQQQQHFSAFRGGGAPGSSSPFGQPLQNAFTVESVFGQQTMHQQQPSYQPMQTTPFNQPSFSFQQALQASTSNSSSNAMSELNPFAAQNQPRLAIMAPLSGDNTADNPSTSLTTPFGPSNNAGGGGQPMNPFINNHGRAY
ncbi:hypothetical protein SeMB42_g03039 [Synchytrium endobioticum]|uniref:ENTH domain-containing protein n=1 Tax=Synchytrium endobioticum TaxID=286115 RepID=A0A507D8M2_9FUNG|nr:hypothetical protein SeLEV6574_g02405 [Synchytrium endobioticum]TPX48309.1 hypothetical protein SeMB42_g03039 [Synchytrium endobioticum]